jgi:nucleoside-diphosphate-sugar epimerase
MKVFLAGATGAIGRQLVPRLVAAGHEVHAMTHASSKAAMIKAMGAIPVVADALDAQQVGRAVAEAVPDAIIHQLTAIPKVVNTHRMARDFEQTNRLRIVGTDNLLSAAQAVGVKRFIAQSHIAIYARQGRAALGEEDPVDRDPPSQMRPNLDAMCHLEGAVLQPSWCEGIVLRYGWFYGPGTSMAPESNQVELIRKRMFPLIGNGGAIWSFVHIADAADATVAALEHGHRGVYNIVDDDPAPVSDWLPALARMLGAKPPLRLPKFIGRLAAGEAAVVMMTELRGASNAKAKRDLRWVPRHPSWRDSFLAEGAERPRESAARHGSPRLPFHLFNHLGDPKCKKR